jgi:hypothetical protein
MKALRILGCMAIVSLIGNPASAHNVRVLSTNSIKPAPAPLIGVGLPMAGAALLALLLVRQFR